jgi:DNA-binding PadR family transcriptional regulator
MSRAALNEFERTVLQEIGYQPLRVDMYGEFQSKARLKERFTQKNHEKLDQAIIKLLQNEYIEEIEEKNSNGAHWGGYRYTPQGRNYLAQPVYPSNNTDEQKSLEIPDQQLKLVKSKNGRKYIVEDGIKHYLPDTETKNALGLEGGKFIQLPDRKLETLEDGANIESVKSPSTRLVRTKENLNEVFIIFTWPDLHRRHVPDEDTLKDMHRRQGQVEVISKEEMQSIPEKDALNPSGKWDPGIIKNKEYSKQGIINYFYGNVENPIGINNGRAVSKKTILNKSSGKIFQIFLVFLAFLGTLIAGYLFVRLGWK